MTKNAMHNSPRREYVISLVHRKARGAGCERPAEILKAARELFLKQGVENVTTRQIAARVGISQTALYVYFSSKEEMLDAMAEDAWRGLVDALAGRRPQGRRKFRPGCALARDPLPLTCASGWAVPTTIASSSCANPCVLAQVSDNPQFAVRDGLLARLAERFAEAARAGLARDNWRPEAAALAMWAAVSGPVALRLAFPDLSWPPEDEHVKVTIDMIIQGCDGRGHKGAAKVLEPTAEGITFVD